jgi:hypothetical protein
VYTCRPVGPRFSGMNSTVQYAHILFIPSRPSTKNLIQIIHPYCKLYLLIKRNLSPRQLHSRQIHISTYHMEGTYVLKRLAGGGGQSRREEAQVPPVVSDRRSELGSLDGFVSRLFVWLDEVWLCGQGLIRHIRVNGRKAGSCQLNRRKAHPCQPGRNLARKGQ